MDGDEHDAGLLEPKGMGRIERKKEIMKTKQEGRGGGKNEKKSEGWRTEERRGEPRL